MLTVEQPDLRICRMSVSARDGATSIAHFHYLVGDADGVRHFEETHALALYSHEEMMGFFRSAGFNVRHDPAGIAGRGLYIAKPVLS
jgi:hypothetical protein